MTIAVTYARPSGFGKAMVTRGPDKGLLSYWPQLASFGLHGALLAAALLALREPSPEPVNAAAPVIAVAFVAASASVPASIDPPAPEPEPRVQEPEPVAPSSAAVEDVLAVEEPPPVPESPAVEVVPPPPAPKPKPEVKPEPKPKVRPVKAQEKLQTKAQPQPRGAPSQETPASVTGVEGSTQPTALQQAAILVVAPPAAIAPPADYVSLIRAQLERNKVYPRTAQQRRQQGRAMLRIVIDRGGRVLGYKLEQGTGHDVLDHEMVAMIQRASPLPPIPASIAGERLELVVPVEFSLR